MQAEDLARLLGDPSLPASIKHTEKTMLASLPKSSLGRLARQVINSGGKRLRPALTIAAASLNGKGATGRVSTIAASIELAHLASLVHDDVIDKSQLRRGRPSVYSEHGLEAATLLGDFLLAEGCGLAAKADPSAGKILADTIAVMAEGQAREQSGSPRPLSQSYYEVAGQKTASLFSAACRLGALAGGLSNKDQNKLASYGLALGIAFQIIDDISDKDIPSAQTANAVTEIKRFNRLASDSLKGTAKNPIAARLKKLPDYYLNWALPRANDIV